MSQGSGCLLPTRLHDPCDSGQPLRALIQRDAKISGNATEPLQVRAHPRARLMAKYRRDPLWKDGAHLSQTHPRSIEGGTPPAHPERDRRDQSNACSPPMEGFRGPRTNGYCLMKRYTRYMVGAISPILSTLRCSSAAISAPSA